MVLEYGDIDLARLLAKHEQARREGGGADELDENFIRLYWQQMLQVCNNLCLLASVDLFRGEMQSCTLCRIFQPASAHTPSIVKARMISCPCQNTGRAMQQSTPAFFAVACRT